MRELRVDLKHDSSEDPNYGFYSRILCIPIFLWFRLMFLTLEKSTQVDGHPWRFIGDDSGWLYSHRDGGSEHNFNAHSWSPDLNLHSSSQAGILHPLATLKFY